MLNKVKDFLKLYIIGMPYWCMEFRSLWLLCCKEKIFFRGCAEAVLKKRISTYGSFVGNLNCFKKLPILPHGLSGIFVSKDAKIGKGCVIFQQVTIGSNSLIDSKGCGAPVIGDYCYIGAGAKIIGNVHIGNNCRIGANAVVVKDIPDNSTVYMGGDMCIKKIQYAR